MSKIVIDGIEYDVTLTRVGASPAPTPSPAPVPAPVPAPTPTPIPPVTVGADTSMDLNVASTHVLEFQKEISGSSGYSISFVADATQFPHGVVLTFFEPPPHGKNVKEFCVSTSPHVFDDSLATQVGPVVIHALKIGEDGMTIPVAFGKVSDTDYAIVLNPGQTYFLNIRDHAIPAGTVGIGYGVTARP